MIRPTMMVVFDSVRDEISVVTPVRPQPGGRRARRLRPRRRAARSDRRHPRRAARPCAAAGGPACCRRCSPVSNTTRSGFPGDGRARQGLHRAPAIFSRSCCRSAFRRPSICRLSRSIARCGASIRRRSSATSISAASRSSARARKSWCACATARSPSARSPAPAGAARRSREDEALAEELLADPKERAEHLMLLDLGRNDVGRVAEIGSVEVTEQFCDRALQPRHAYRLERRRPARRQARRDRRAGRRLSGRHRLRRAESARHGDHRRARSRQARRLRRLHRLFRRLRRNGHLHRAAHLDHQGRRACTCRPAPASSTTANRRYEHRECVNKAKALFRAAEEAVRFATRAKKGQ